MAGAPTSANGWAVAPGGTTRISTHGWALGGYTAPIAGIERSDIILDVQRRGIELREHRRGVTLDDQRQPITLRAR